MATFYLIRNAEAQTNLKFKKGRVGGISLNSKLTKNGILQAKSLKNKLKKINFDKVYSSPAIRAKQTAKHSIGKYTLTSSLLELDQGDWEGKSKEDVYKRKATIQGLKKDCWNFRPGDKVKGESQKMVAKRIKNWIKKTARSYPDKTIAAFSHAYSIKYFLADILNSNKNKAYKIPIDNTSITIVIYKNNKFKCLKQNDTSHLTKARLTKTK